MTESSTVLLWESVVNVWLPKQFPWRVFHLLKMLMGPPGLLHLQSFFRVYIPEKGGIVGSTGAACEESWILVTALCFSSPCVTLEKWLCFCKVLHEKG